MQTGTASSRASFAAFSCLVRLSPGFQIPRLGDISWWGIQQPNCFNVQSDGDLLKKVERRVEITALQPANGSAIDTRINRQRFLSYFLGGPQRPEVPRHSVAQLHGSMGTILLPVYPSDISDIISVRLKVAFTRERME